MPALRPFAPRVVSPVPPRAVGTAALLLLLSGCGCPRPSAPVSVAAPQTDAGDETIALQGVELVGSWAEFWAPPQGEAAADTQRFVFLDDGRFGWSPAGGAGLCSGRYTVDGDTLVLQVERADGAGGELGERRLALGPCPPNEEARALDAAYRCLGIGGDAFWLRGAPGEAEIARYF